MTQNMFCSEVELSKFLGNIDVIRDTCQAISETYATHQFHTNPFAYNLFTNLPGFQVLAFHCSPNYTTRFLNGEFDLVYSENHQVVEFISTKVNPSFSINEAAVRLFEHLGNELEELETKVISSPLVITDVSSPPVITQVPSSPPIITVITGHSLGGYLAILFALWVQHSIDVKESKGSMKTKRPICITFGSPLVGDEALLHAISARPQWKSRFLNVVTNKDPVASIFSAKSLYRPFGSFLFCMESGNHSTFEDQEAILTILDNMTSSSTKNYQILDYKNNMSSIRRKALYHGVCESGNFELNPLRAGITLQLRKLEVQQNILNDLTKKMEDKQKDMITRKKNVYEPTKKLNDSKIHMTFMEWYMKTRRSSGGYYDCYKNPETKDEKKSQQEIILIKGKLNKYWEEFVKEKDLMPQKEGAKLRKRWLLAANNYRRVIEPLDIAEYYKNINSKVVAEEDITVHKTYIANRPKHYVLLEDWFNEYQKDVKPSDREKREPNLSDNSCFWAYVEEALISLRDLKITKNTKEEALISLRNDIEVRLEGSMTNMMHAINNHLVSSDVFLKKSSFMNYWRNYKEYKEGSLVSQLAEFMNSKKYESYQ